MAQRERAITLIKKGKKTITKFVKHYIHNKTMACRTYIRHARKHLCAFGTNCACLNRGTMNEEKVQECGILRR